MPSSYSDNLRIELIANGEQTGTWGSTTNNNMGMLIESAITGYIAVPVSGTAQALQALNGVEDQARNMYVRVYGSPSAGFTLFIPPAEKLYAIFNDTGVLITVRTATAINSVNSKGGTTAEIPIGKTVLVMSDGTDMHIVLDHVEGDLSVSGDLIVSGGVGVLDGLVVTNGITADTLSLGTALDVPNGGTGATTLTNGAILRGNGTGAVSAASAADIVAVIDTTAVTNSTNTTNILGGGANRIPYNTGTSATTFLAAPTTSAQFLKYDGASIVWAELPASGVLSVTADAPLASSGGANPNITINSAVGPTLGGTGISTYTTGDILYASAANTLAKLAGGVGNNGKFLTITAGIPTWGTPATGLTSFTINTATSGTLSGGTTVSTSGQTVSLSVASGGIGPTQLASNAVTTAKILNGNVTAAKIDNMTLSAGSPGYQKLPGGLILQWGVTVRTGATTTCDFPVAFTAGNCYSITLTTYNATGSGGGSTTALLMTLPSAATTGFDVGTASAQTHISWMAVGIA